MAQRNDDTGRNTGRNTGEPASIVPALLVGAFIVAVAVLGAPSPKAHADTLQTSITISICGNGIVDSGETCDDGLGFNLGAYGSTSAQRNCTPDCQSFGPYCGDGTLQVRFGEQCDDGGGNGGSSLCSLTCQSLPAVSASNPTQVVGSIPQQSAPPGAIPSATPTQVVLRGKAYPNSSVNILLDGILVGSAHADSNADFLYNTTAIPPGIATLSFWAADSTGVNSITTSVVFDIVQSALTSVNNIFLPPSLSINKRQIAPGDPATLSGESVPFAQVITSLDTDTSDALASPVDSSGKWALQLDTSTIKTGLHSAKVSFVLSTTSKSGYGKSLSFFVGNQLPVGGATPDINGDGKVNLVDFSIFLLGWGSVDPRDDFNADGTVNLADFSIMLFDWTG